MALRREDERVNEVAYWNEKSVARIDLRYFGLTEVETLLNDRSKAKQKLGWVPEIIDQEMFKQMVAYGLAHAKQHALLKAKGYPVNVSIE